MKNTVILLIALLCTSSITVQAETYQFLTKSKKWNDAFKACGTEAEAGSYYAQYAMYVLHCSTLNERPKFVQSAEIGYYWLDQVKKKGSRRARLDFAYASSTKASKKYDNRYAYLLDLAQNGDNVAALKAATTALIFSEKMTSALWKPDLIKNLKKALDEIEINKDEDRYYIDANAIQQALDLIGQSYKRGEGNYIDYVKAYAYINAAGRLASDIKLSHGFGNEHFSDKMTKNQIEEAQSLTSQFYEKYVQPFPQFNGIWEPIDYEEGKLDL